MKALLRLDLTDWDDKFQGNIGLRLAINMNFHILIQKITAIRAKFNIMVKAPTLSCLPYILKSQVFAYGLLGRLIIQSIKNLTDNLKNSISTLFLLLSFLFLLRVS